jgi:hypothetical protein
MFCQVPTAPREAHELGIDVYTRTAAVADADADARLVATTW